MLRLTSADIPLVHICIWKNKFLKSETGLYYTHGGNNLPIPAMAYFINDLDIQRSGRGRDGPTYSKVGEVLYMFMY